MGKKKGRRVFVFCLIITDGLAIGNISTDACETRRFINPKKRCIPMAAVGNIDEPNSNFPATIILPTAKPSLSLPTAKPSLKATTPPLLTTAATSTAEPSLEQEFQHVEALHHHKATYYDLLHAGRSNTGGSSSLATPAPVPTSTVVPLPPLS
ncbi:hypothetical protein PIB30_044887 [Stylosanthes scabra]|uniref:Uncharacterized protein n=1 Tax=Stylosanthes scabra TaxID=79078 RepID=A0ABU6TI32_9FABA|nr:hypothetical protein [Stylosanthes scabra]